MKRYAETFFRYWLIALVPLILLPAAEYLVIKHSPKTVQSSANLWVNQGLGAADATNQFETAAQMEGDAINQLIQSPSFDLSVAQASPAYRLLLAKTSDPSGTVTTDLSKNVLTDPVGPNLLKISYTADNWVLALQVVQNLINAVSNQTAVLSEQATKASINYYSSQLQSLKLNAATSARRLRDYMTEHNIRLADIVALMPTDSTLATYYQQSQADQSAVNNAQSQLSQLRTKLALPPAESQQTNFRVQDSPSVAIVSSKKKDIMNLAIALVLGLLVGGGFIVVKTLLDRSLRYADEVHQLLGLPILAVMPYRSSLATTPPSQAALALPKSSKRDLGDAARRIG